MKNLSKSMKKLALLIALIAASQYSMAYCTNNLGGGIGDAPLDTAAILGTTLYWGNPNLNLEYQFATGANATATLMQGQTYTFYLYTQGSFNAIASFWIDYDQNGTWDTYEWTQICTNNTGAQYVSFTVPIGATLGATQMRVRTRDNGNNNYAGDACTTFGSGETADFNVTIIAATPCSGQPTAGTAVGSPTSGCTSYTSNLSLSGATMAGNINFQWQSSTNGTTWTNVSGATNATYAANVTATTYYRAYLVCTNSNLADTSTGVQLVLTGNPVTYGSVPFFEGFENWGPGCYSYDRPDANMITNPTSGNSSWRRDDQGNDASWSSNFGTYFPTSTEGSHSARFHSYDCLFESGNLDLYLDLSAAGSKKITFDYINGDQYLESTLSVQLSTDGGATFTTLNTYSYNANWSQINLVTAATAPQCVIRFQGYGLFAYPTDIGIDSLSVTILPQCAGAPTAGPIQQSQASACSAYNDVLTVVTPIYQSGISYQWQSSTNGTTWTNVSGATDYTYVPNVTATTYFRFYVSCANSGLGDTSASVEAQIVTPVPTYATLPYFQDFENWMGTCTNYDRPSLNWLNNPATGNASWRRDDQGTDGQWSSTNGAYFPASNEGSHSARFHSYDCFFETGDLDLYLDLSAAGTKQINFDYINGDGTYGYLTVMLSTDGGATFNTIQQYGQQYNWTPEMFTTATTSSTCVLRFEGYGEFAYPDLGIDSVWVHVLPPCSGAPVAGTIAASDTMGCIAYLSNLSFTNPPIATGITYQWQSSTNGVNWTNIAGATDNSYQITVSATVYVRAYVVCTISNLADTTNIQELHLIPEVPTVASLPYFNGFENWTGTCYNFDRPDTNWLTNPTYGNNSWRRDDQGGTDGGWTYDYIAMYSPASEEGSHSARFHSYEATYGQIGDMDLHIDLSTSTGSKNINFYYINPDGSDYVTVELSEDGGVTFTTLGTVYTAPNWTHETFSTPSVAANAIIRFEGWSDYGFSDLGMDSLWVYAPCPPPTNITMTSISATGANASWTAVPTALGYTYLFDQSNGTPTATGTFTAGTTASASGLSINTQYYVHVRTICTVGDTSAWAILPFMTGDTCYAPVNLIASNITYNSADVSWSGNPSAASYEYVLDMNAGSPAGSGTNTTNTTYSATGLTMNTTYYFHLREICTNGDTSIWITIPINLLPNSVPVISNDDFKLNATPNPATGIVNVNVLGNVSGNPEITVTDVVGKLIIPAAKVDGKKAQVDMTHLTPGTYFINYNDAVHKQTIKITKE